MFKVQCDDHHYGWVVNTHYEWINMLIKMQNNKPQRFDEFKYSQSTIYHYLDKVQQDQNLYD
jgi:hypothetical protein